jgi:hypothetical protein
VLRPWYVLGPGHCWPYALKPFYALASQFDSHRAAAERLALVTLEEMTRSLVAAVENPPPRYRLVEAPEIRAGLRQT